MSLIDLLETKNPWWRDPAKRPTPKPRQREVFEHLRRALEDPDPQRALVLVGPRQVGKTTLLRQLARHFLDQGWPPGNVVYFDFKDDRFDPSLGVRSILDATPPAASSRHPRLLLLDEVTSAASWDLVLKQLVDTGRETSGSARDRILVTDSAAALIRSDATESLQGRIAQTDLHGLTFREALHLQQVRSETPEETFLALPGALDRYLALGGLPEHLTADSREVAWERIRRDVTEGAIARDLARTANLDVERIAALFRHLVQESGSLFEANNRVSDLAAPGEKGPDARTIRRWVALLEQASLVVGLDPWHPGLRRGQNRPARALRVKRKIYAEDHGMVLAFSPFSAPLRNSEVRSRVHETVVFTHLRAYCERRTDVTLRYFREDHRSEVDFVLDFGDAVLGVEATSSKGVDAKKQAKVRKAAGRAGLDRALVVHGGGRGPESSEEWATWPIDRFLLDPEAVIEESLQWIRTSR